MTVQTLKLGRERFVLLKEKDYRQLKAKAQAKPARPTRRLTAQDKGDIAEATRRRNEPARPYAELQAKPARHRQRLSAQDRADLAEARRIMADPNEKPILYEQVRKELGLV